MLNQVIEGYRLSEFSRVNADNEPASVFRATRIIDLKKAVLKLSKTALAEITILPLTRNPVFPQLLASGEHQDNYFAVLQDFDGGDLLDRINQGIELQEVLAALRQIAVALDELHSLGYVHADIKPEHIVFTHHGSPGLIDYSSAINFMEPGTTQNLSRPASPQYASPEQIMGRQLDGRSDLYSLGVVLFEVLTGQLPFIGEEIDTVLQKHLQEPVPRLPNHLVSLQMIIDSLLAKRPEKRFVSGGALNEELSRIALDMRLPELTIKTQPIKTREISALSAELRTIALEPQQQMKRATRKRRRKIVLQSFAIVLVGSIVLGMAFLLREEVTASLTNVGSSLGIIENPELTFARTEAESLRQDLNQGLATIVAAYQRILVIEPNDAEASAALDEVVKYWRNSIDQAMVQGDLGTADIRLREALSVLNEDPELTVLSLKLQNRYQAERLLRSAQSLLTSHGLSDLPSAAAAIQAYQEMLRIAPEHPAAEQGLIDLSTHYIQLARNAAEKGEVNNAISLLERASAANNTLRELDDVRKLISQAATAQAAINKLLVEARRLRAENFFIQPPGANAAELYQRVLTTDPDNMIALQGLNEVAAQVFTSARALLEAEKLDQAETLLGQGYAAGLPSQPITELRQLIENQRARNLRVLSLLEQATNLMEQGYLTAPISNNATALLREVQQLDPPNVRAKAMLDDCAERLSEVAKEAYAFNLYRKAKEYMDLALTIKPEVSQWIKLRENWELDQRI